MQANANSTYEPKNLNRSRAVGMNRTNVASESVFTGPAATFAASLLLTGLVALIIKSTCRPGSWGYEFFFHRRFMQWIIVWMCVHGLLEAARRLPVWWRERRGLRVWQNGGVPAANAGLVAERHERLQWLLECAAVSDIRAGANRLSEEAASQLDARYSTINVLTHLASYCGFFGTVLGLSIGLFEAFGSTGAISLKSFGGAVSTSFDNTLSGVACTILLIMVQSLVRAREEFVLTATDQLAEDTLLNHERAVAAALGVNDLAVSPQNQAEIYSQTVNMMAAQVREAAEASQSLMQQTHTLIGTLTQDQAEIYSQTVNMMAAQVREVTEASQSLVQQTRTLIETLTQTNGNLHATFHEVAAAHRSVQAVDASLQNGLTQVADATNAQAGQIEAVVTHAGQLESQLVELKEVCSRRRVLTVTETV